MLSVGGRPGGRTPDLLIKSQLLYQLSYASIPAAEAVSRFALGGAPVAGDLRIANPFFAYQPVFRRLSRSIDIRMPRHSSTVICADPPKLTSGSGMPTTGASPITIIRLIAT